MVSLVAGEVVVHTTYPLIVCGGGGSGNFALYGYRLQISLSFKEQVKSYKELSPDSCFCSLNFEVTGDRLRYKNKLPALLVNVNNHMLINNNNVSFYKHSGKRYHVIID